MSKHISDELPRLLTGDATHDVVMEAAEHLRTCPDCQQELVSSVVAHASLTSAHRFAPEVVSPGPTRGPSLPPVTRIHSADAAESGDDAGDADDAAADEGQDAEPEPLPDLSSVFERARAEAAQAKARPGRGRRGLLAVAAAAVVLAGGGTAIGFAVAGGSGPSGRTVAMASFEHGQGSGKATIGGDTVTLDASSLPRLRATQRYEVWLTDGARKHMYSIGFLGDGSSASFKVKHDYLTRFSAIEVSLQDKGQVDYSHYSVLRGTYA